MLMSPKMTGSYLAKDEKRAEKVRELFDAIAPRYDLINDLQSFWLHRHWKRCLVQLAEVKPGQRTFDLCCGTGDIALALAGQGARVVLIDDQPELGGHLRSSHQNVESVPGYAGQPGFQLAQAMAASVAQASNIEVMSNATVFGFYQDNLLGILNEDALVRLRAGKVVLATGSYETPVLFEDNDLPGIMLASAARRLVGRSQEVEETRESLFSWKRANNDMAEFLGAWWANLISPKDGSERARKDPRDPREFYHSLLGLAERVGQPRQDWETPREHQLALVGLLPADPVASIVEGFQAYHYGHSELDEPEIERLTQDWLDLNEFLRQKESNR